MSGKATEQTGLLVAFSVIIAAGLVGNGLVCLVLLHNKFLRQNKPVNRVLLNLALADTTVLLFLAPRHVFFSLFTHPTGSIGDYLCKFITGGNIAWIGAVTSVFSLVFIALERYFAVIKPHHYARRFNQRFVKTVVVCSWFCAFCFCLPLFFVVKYNEDMAFCVEDWGNAAISQCYAVLWFLIAGLFPVVAMVYLYSNVIYVLWIKRRSRDINIGQLATRLARQKTRKRICKVLFIISFIYCASWFPPLTNYILVYFQPNHSFSNITYLGSVVMVTFNSSINPVIYACYSGQFREHLRELIRLIIKREKTGNSNDMRSPVEHLNDSRVMMTVTRSDTRNVTGHVNTACTDCTGVGTAALPRQQESRL